MKRGWTAGAAALLMLLFSLAASGVHAGAQMYEPLSASVRAALNKAIADQAVPYLAFDDEAEARAWLAVMSARLAKRMPDRVAREEFLVTVHYEAKRAGLDPQLVLGLIQVESAFRKHAVSTAGARGFMQVMPFWVNVIGSRRSESLPPAHEPALRLRDPAALSRHGKGRSLPGARALQRQSRPRRIPEHRAPGMARHVALPGAHRRARSSKARRLGDVARALARGTVSHKPTFEHRAPTSARAHLVH